MNNNMHEMHVTEGPHTPAGVRGFPSKPSHHQGFIRVEMKTSLLEVSFSGVFVFLMLFQYVLLPFLAAFGVLPVIYLVKGECFYYGYEGISLFFFFSLSLPFWPLNASS